MNFRKIVEFSVIPVIVILIAWLISAMIKDKKLHDKQMSLLSSIDQAAKNVATERPRARLFNRLRL